LSWEDKVYCYFEEEESLSSVLIYFFSLPWLLLIHALKFNWKQPHALRLFSEGEETGRRTY